MKKGFLYLFSFAMLFQSMMVPMIFLDYQIRYRAYLESCINQARPELDCKGQCQLMQKIERAHQQENSPVNPFRGSIEINPIIGMPIPIQLPDLFALDLEYGLYLDKAPYPGIAFSIFHPPRV